MTAEPAPTIAEGALLINTETQAPDPSTLVVPFQLDDDPTVLHATRPKMAVLLKAAQAVMVDDQPGDVVPGAAQIGVFVSLMDKMFTPETVDYLNARWDDNDDDLDVDCLGPIFQALVGLWYRRPTGSPAASQRPRPRSGKRSTARSRSKG